MNLPVCAEARPAPMAGGPTPEGAMKPEGEHRDEQTGQR